MALNRVPRLYLVRGMVRVDASGHRSSWERRRTEFRVVVGDLRWLGFGFGGVLLVKKMKFGQNLRSAHFKNAIIGSASGRRAADALSTLSGQFARRRDALMTRTRRAEVLKFLLAVIGVAEKVVATFSRRALGLFRVVTTH